MSRKTNREARKERVQQLKVNRVIGQADTPEQRRITAYHESAHAVLAELCDFAVDWVTCIPEVWKGSENCLAQMAQKGGMIAIRAGHIQLVLTGGCVPMSCPERRFFHMIGELASLPTEVRLGVPRESVRLSCNGDIEKAKSNLIEDEAGMSHKIFMNAALLAHMFVNHTAVWTAIENTAKLLLQKGRIVGADVRRVVREVVSDSIFFSEERQRNIWSEGGPPVAIIKALELALA